MFSGLVRGTYRTAATAAQARSSSKLLSRSSLILSPSQFINNKLSQQRSIHNLPQIANQLQYEQQGIPGLYSKEGFRDVWTDYQQLLVDELSRQTAETENETRTPFGIMLNTAERELDASIFNYASQAHNNHLFVEALRPSALPDGAHVTNSTKPSPKLLQAIEKNFGSFEGLKEDILATVTSPEYLGAGWLFLIEGDDKSLYLQYCFQAGSPYFVGRSQPYDLNVPLDKATSDELDNIKLDILDKARSYPMPLIAINCWEVAYTADYSTTGRETFIENVWNSLDWDIISKRYYGN